MAAPREDFLEGEDLGDLYYLLDGGFLDEDFEIDKDLDSLLIEESLEKSFKCNLCDKVCKAQRGLTRHKNTKHTIIAPLQVTPSTSQLNQKEENILKKFHPLQLNKIVKNCAIKCSNDMCLPEEVRANFTSKNFSFNSDNSLQLWNHFKNIIEEYNGSAESFYAQYYGLLSENLLPTKFEDITLTNILLTEVANFMLLHLSGDNNVIPSSNESTTATTASNLSEKEIKVLQYLAGFIIHKLYKKYKYSKHNIFQKQYLSILLACKVDSDISQRYIEIRDRGGLWKTSSDTQKIIIQCEKIFRKHTKSFATSINSKTLVFEMLQDCFVISSFKNICYNSELEVGKEVAFNILESMLLLFVRVRSFSYADDVREKYRYNKNQTKKSSLITEIKKSSRSKELGH